MELKAVAKKPQLIKITLDSEYVFNAYGESLDFYMMDRQSIPTYMKFATIDQKDTGALVEAVRELVLDSSGKPMLEPDDYIEPNVMLDMINAVVTQLGNSQSQTSAT